MRNTTVITALCSVALGLLIAGCGGGGASSGESPSIDKATFVRQAEEVCETVSGKITADMAGIARREAATPGYDVRKTELSVEKTVLVPRLEEELREIQALGIPEEAKKAVQALLTAYQGSIDGAKKNPTKVLEGFNPYESVELAAKNLDVSNCPVKPVNIS